MYIVITENDVYMEKSLNALNKKLNGNLEHNEFKSVGSNYAIKITNDDLSFIQDKKRLSKIPIQNLYKTNDTTWLLYVIVIMIFILLIRG